MLRLYRFLGIAFSVLSLTLLIKRGFDMSFTSVLDTLLAYYDRATEAVLGWASPWIGDRLREFGIQIGWDLKLHGHWRHIFLLLLIYFSAGTRAYATRTNGHYAAFFSLTWGFAVALCTGVASGAVSLDGISFAENFLFGFFPIAGATIYDMGRYAFDRVVLGTPIGDFSQRYSGATGARVTRTVLRAIAGVILLVLSLSTAASLGLANPGLLSASVLLIALGSYWLAVGAMISRSSAGVSWRQAWLSQSSTSVGLGILGTIAGAAIFVLANAGLNLAGL